MSDATAPTAFSITVDGKHHDATFIADGRSVAVIYWGRQGVIRLEAPLEETTAPEQVARKLLSQLI